MRFLKTRNRDGKQLKTFSGARAGCLAKLAPEEVQLLLQDNSVQAVEPDRILSLSTCFKVVEPTLLTWGTKRVAMAMAAVNGLGGGYRN
jgi:hypothetical protein